MNRWRSGRELVVSAAVLGASLVLGGLTSVLQGALPSALSSLANSASGWTLMTALLVWLARRRTWLSAVLGAGSFVLLTVGYALVSNARGYYFSPVFWAAVGLVAGPFVGAAAAWLRTRDRRLALGAGLLAGIGVGEGAFGLTAVAATTSPVYWTVMVVVGLLLALWAGWRLRTVNLIALLVATVALTAAGLNLAGRMI